MRRPVCGAELKGLLNGRSRLVGGHGRFAGGGHSQDIARVRPLGTLMQFIGYTASLLKGLEAIHLDDGIMGENIHPFIVGFNKTETFGITEPFDRTCSHADHHLIGEPVLRASKIIL